jgi:hypothetical protein
LFTTMAISDIRQHIWEHFLDLVYPVVCKET